VESAEASLSITTTGEMEKAAARPESGPRRVSRGRVSPRATARSAESSFFSRSGRSRPNGAPVVSWT
jgi:hypothetical protein